MRPFYGLVFLLLALCAGYASYATIGNIWDGSCVLFQVLSTGRPVLAHGRSTHTLFFLPVMWAASHTDNYRILGALWSAPYWIFALGSAALCLGLLRRSSTETRVLAFAIILGIALPGQIMVFAESIHLAQLLPAMVILAATPLTTGRSILLSSLVLFGVLHHPGGAITAGVTLAILCTRILLRRQEASRSDAYTAILLVAVAAFAAWRLLFGLAGYEQEQRSWAMTLHHYSVALHGIPELAVAALYCGMFALLAGRFLPVSRWPMISRALALLTVAAIGVMAALMWYWAGDPAKWMHADAYRRFPLILSLPLAVALAGISYLDSKSVQLPRPRLGIEVLSIGLIASAFVGCLTIQSSIFGQMNQRLRDQLASSAGPILYGDSLKWAASSALNIWSAPCNAAILQGRSPHVLATFAAPERVDVNAATGVISFGGLPVIDTRDSGRVTFRNLDLAARGGGGRATVVSVASEYQPESWRDGSTFYWVRNRIAQTFEVSKPDAGFGQLRFWYVSATRLRRATLVLRGAGEILREDLDMGDGYNAYDNPREFLSHSFPVVPGRYTLEFTTTDAPVTASPTDPRKISVMLIGTRLETAR